MPQRSSRLGLHRLYFSSNCVFSGWGEKDEQAGPRHLTPYTPWPLGMGLIICKEYNIPGVGCAVRICVFKDLIYPICPLSTLQVKTLTFAEEQGSARGHRESRASMEVYQHQSGWYKLGILVTL